MADVLGDLVDALETDDWLVRELSSVVRSYEPTTAMVDVLDDEGDEDDEDEDETSERAWDEEDDDEDALERAWDEADHPRIPEGMPGGGRFRSVFARVASALKAWDGKGDPLKDFTDREQLRGVAKKRGITLRRGASIDEIKAALADDYRKNGPSEKVAGDGQTAAPAKAAKKAAPVKKPPRTPLAPGEADDIAEEFSRSRPTEEQILDRLAGYNLVELRKVARATRVPLPVDYHKTTVGPVVSTPRKLTADELRQHIATTIIKDRKQFGISAKKATPREAATKVPQTGHVANDAQARSGWKSNDKLTHSTRGEVTYLGPDEHDSAGFGGGAGGAHWVEFKDGTSGMVSGEKLSGYVPPATPRKATPKAPDLTGDKAPKASARKPASARTKKELEASIATGVVGHESLPQGKTSATRIDTFADGQRAVHKRAIRDWNGLTPKDQADAEELTATVGAAIGAPVPAVHRDGDDAVYVDFVDGTRGDEMFAPYQLPTGVNDDDVRRLGLLDLLIANPDRFADNYMVDDSGGVHGIDHAVAWSPTATAGGPGDAPVQAGTFGQVFIQPGGMFGSPSFKQGPFTAEELTDLRAKLVPLRGEFDRLGHRDWYDYSLGRMDELIKAAGGPRKATGTPAAKKAAPSTADIPDLTGLTTRQKRARLKALGFTPEQIDELAPTAAMLKAANGRAYSDEDDDDWELVDALEELVEAERAFDPNQPRIPRGNPISGRWVSLAGGLLERRSAVAKHVTQWHADTEDLDGLVHRVASGASWAGPLAYGTNGRTRADLTDFGDGTEAVVTTYLGGDAERAGDADQLASALGRAIGVPAPRVMRIAEDQTVGELVDGPTWAEREQQILADIRVYELEGETPGDYVPMVQGNQQKFANQPPSATAKQRQQRDLERQRAEMLASDAALRVGVLDLLAGIDERDNGTLVLTPGGVVTVQSEFGWVYADGRNRATEAAAGRLSRADGKAPPVERRVAPHFLRMWGAFSTIRSWRDNPLTANDIAYLRAQLDEVRPQFESLGRKRWWRFASDRLDALARHATGTRDLFASS